MARKRDAAEAELRKKQYAYKNNMNLVLENKRGRRRNFKDEGTGEAQRVDARKIASKMGDRVRRSSDLNALKLKAATKRLKRQEKEEEVKRLSLLERAKKLEEARQEKEEAVKRLSLLERSEKLKGKTNAPSSPKSMPVAA